MIAALAASALTQQAEGFRYAAGNRPENAGASPEHAFESVTTADAVFVIVVIIRHMDFLFRLRPATKPARQGLDQSSGRIILARGCA